MTKNKKLGFVATAFIASSFVLAGGVTALNYNKTNAETVGGTITVSDDFTQAGSMSDLNAYAYSHVAKSPDGHSFGLMPIDKWAATANPESGWITYKVEADEGYVLQDTVVAFRGALNGCSCNLIWGKADVRVYASPNGQDWKYIYSQRTNNNTPEGDWNQARTYYDLSVELPDVYDGLEEVYVRYELVVPSYTELNDFAVLKGHDSIEAWWGASGPYMRADDETRTVLVYREDWTDSSTTSEIGVSMQNVSITANQAVKATVEADTVSVEDCYGTSYATESGKTYENLWDSDVYEYAGYVHDPNATTGIFPYTSWGDPATTSKTAFLTYKLEADEGKVLTSVDYTFIFRLVNGSNGTQWDKLQFDIDWSYDNTTWNNVLSKRGRYDYETFNSTQIRTTEADTIALDGKHTEVYVRFKNTNHVFSCQMRFAPYFEYAKVTATQEKGTVYAPKDSYVKEAKFGTASTASYGFKDSSNILSVSSGSGWGLVPTGGSWAGSISVASGHFTYAIPLNENGKALADLTFTLKYYLREKNGGEDIIVSVSYDNATWTQVQSMAERGFYSGLPYSSGSTPNSSAVRFSFDCVMDLTQYVSNAEGDTLYVRVDTKNIVEETCTLQSAPVKIASVKFEGDYAVLSNGAAVRLSGQNGIRFETIVKDSFVSAKQEAGYTLTYGTFIMPVDYLTSKGALTEANLFGDNAIFCWGKAEAGKTQILHRTANLVKTAYTPDGYSTFYYSILNVKEENLNRGFVALGYIAMEKDGVVEYIFADGGKDVASTARSATYVAQKAIESGDLTGEQPHALWEAYISKCDTATTRTASVKLKNVYVLKTIAEDGTETISVVSDYGETQTGNIGQLYSKEHSDVTYSGVAYTAVDCIEIDGELFWSQQSCFVKADGTSELVRYNYAVVDNSAKVA